MCGRRFSAPPSRNRAAPHLPVFIRAWSPLGPWRSASGSLGVSSGSLTLVLQPSALPIHPKTVSNLNDKLYEKRKLGALEVEVGPAPRLFRTRASADFFSQEVVKQLQTAKDQVRTDSCHLSGPCTGVGDGASGWGEQRDCLHGQQLRGLLQPELPQGRTDRPRCHRNRPRTCMETSFISWIVYLDSSTRMSPHTSLSSARPSSSASRT